MYLDRATRCQYYDFRYLVVLVLAETLGIDLAIFTSITYR